MANKSQIAAALDELNLEDDTLWTSDGDPRLDAIQEHLGEKVTRAEVKAAAPHFSRSNPDVEEIIQTEAAEGGDPSVSDIPENDGAQTPPELDGDQGDLPVLDENTDEVVDPAEDDASEEGTIDPDDETGLDEPTDDGLKAAMAHLSSTHPEPVSRAAELDKAGNEIGAEIERLKMVQQKLAQEAAKLHEVEEKNKDPHADQKERMRYIKSQQDQRRLRIESARKIAKAVGPDLGKHVHGLSPLDAAMSARKAAPGSTRPNFAAPPAKEE